MIKNLFKILTLLSGPLIVLALYSLDYDGFALYYPAAMSFAVGLAFLLTALFFKPCLIVRIAKLKHKEFPQEAESYCKKLNSIWVVILFLNSLVSLLITQGMNMNLWALYNGFLSYIIISFFIVLEYWYRGIYREKRNKI